MFTDRTVPIVAVADIEEDEELFVIPRGCVLSVENSDLKSRIPQEMAQLDPWLVRSHLGFL